MSSPSTPTSASEVAVEWVADLTLEYGGRTAAAFVSRNGLCVLEITNLTALKSLRPVLADWKTPIQGDGLNRLACILPVRLEIHLHGVSIGSYQPRATLNWEAKALGLPFGSLVIDKLSLIRASLKRT